MTSKRKISASAISVNETKSELADEATAPVESRLMRGDRVQYLGEMLAYRGQKGEVMDIVSKDNAAVLLGGASIPIVFPMTELMLSDEKQADPEALVTSSKPRYRYVANTSGGLLSIPDLKNAVAEDGIALQASEKLDLLSMFTPREINRSRGLVNCTTAISEQSGLPLITVLNSLDDPLPEGSTVKPLAERVEAGVTLEAEQNIYDEKLTDVYVKEEERAEKLAASSTKFTRGRHTTEHGRASSALGKGGGK